MRQNLSPKQLARAIGVSESSLKRWADDGRLNVTRTVGGHRRIDVREAIRFARREGLTIVQPSELGLYELRPLGEKRMEIDEVGDHLRDLLARGDALGARSLLMGLFMEGRGVAWLCDGPIRRALDTLQDDSGDGVVHRRAWGVCRYTLVQIRLMIASPPNLDGNETYEVPEAAAGETDVDEPAASDRPMAVGGAAGDGADGLPSLMAACVLAEAGLDDVDLGPNLPLDTLVQAVERYAPKVAWLAFDTDTRAPTTAALNDAAATIRGSGATLILTGPGGPAAVSRAPGLRVCRTMAELGAFAAGLALA